MRAASGLAAAAGLRGGAPLATGLAGMAAMAAQSSQAADLSGPYRALVCLFMHGGNDSHNWVVPTDTTGYADYARARQELAWPAHKLLPISVSGQAAGRSFGMPEELAPLRRWYEAGQAAIVANVGPLVRPITKPEYAAGMGLPAKLFSHNDQASTWQSLSPEGARSGWGGRLGDILMSANAYPVFTAVSATGNAVFLSGSQVTQYQVGVEGPVAPSGVSSTSVFGSATAPAALRRMLANVGTSPLQAEYVRILQRGMSANTILQTALPGVSVPPIPATTIPFGTGGSYKLDEDDLTKQLRMVAQMVAAGQTLGMRRQVFMVSIGGFDSHANQMRDQPALMARVANAIDYFLTSMGSLGMLNNVALFTASDFGRALLSNGDGSDHGWGSHHFVAGGMVAGRNIHGRFPSTALGGTDDIGSGRLLPSQSVTQMAAPLGRWMGLSSSDLATVLPGIANFDANALRFL
ncbi:hypothetical protein AQPW35_41840 [Rubrivivax pictus]|uniref:Tat pathway signal protein n=1 Tax=Pseudaquabacterium pictum TaxID=2315236 RepID=A0A480AUS1_9BURK|nr:hypothetical protein AQPW35_41840 [Rubrivivax pictus]